jgi:hypothetical protein
VWTDVQDFFLTVIFFGVMPVRVASIFAHHRAADRAASDTPIPPNFAART